MKFWSKLSRKEKTGLAIALGCLAVALVDRLVVSPIRERMDALEMAIRVSEKRLRMNVRNIKQKAVIEEQYAKYADYVRQTGSDEEELARVLGAIEAMARESSVYLVDTKAHGIKKKGFYRQVTAEIEGEGAMASMVMFLHKINSSKQLLRPEKVRLSVKGKSPGVVKVSMLITKVLVF